MTRAPVTMDREGAMHVVHAGAVDTLAEAEAVVDLLVIALDKVVAQDDPFVEFQHRIEFDGPAHLPDVAALHVDARMPGAIQAETFTGFQPAGFWRHVAAMDDGAAVVDHWVAATAKAYADKEAALGFEAEIWESAEGGVQLGEGALCPLALADASWVPAYTDALARWDLGHEVHQQSTIDALLARHGWSDAMRDLLMARVVIDSQHGPEQVFHDMRAALAELLSSDDHEDFYRAALVAFRDETTGWLDWPPDDSAQDTFGIHGPLLQMARDLPPRSGA